MRAVCVFLYIGAVLADDAGVSPVQKVIEMLNDMKAKGEAEKHDEMVAFATYKQFCESTGAEKTRAIADGKDAIEQYKAEIAKSGADVLTLTKEIAALTEDIDGWKAEKDEAQKIRDKDHADFQVVHADYTQAMDAVDRALQVIKTSPGQFMQVRESLLQLQSVHIKSSIMSYLNTDNEPEAESLLELGSKQQPKTYESSSGGVIDMIKKLGKKFKMERYEIEKEEAKTQAAHDMVVQDLTDSIEKATTMSDSKMATKAQREKDGAEAEGALGDTTATLAEDEKFLTDLLSECEMRSKEFETNQVLRAGELTAIGKAIEIMSSDKIGLTQTSSVQDGVSLAQLRTTQLSSLQSRVATFLNARAERTNSRILSLIAIKTSEDPFKKVTKMIRDMITKLMEEANEEAEHKGFCDTEMGTNKNTRDEKSEKVDKLTALIEELNASITKLGEQSTVISDAISAIDAAMAKATAERNEESVKNKAVIADAKVAGEATAQALAVLNEFYAKAKGAAFFQKPYTGMASGGVVGMLEVIQSDFVRLETETTSAEDKAAKAFTAFSRDCSKDKAIRETDLKHTLNSKTEKESELADAGKDLKGTQEELDAALAYFEKLKPSCVDAGQSYEERVAQRKAEIESLQDAFKILNGEA
jgi:hypothetical protein